MSPFLCTTYSRVTLWILFLLFVPQPSVRAQTGHPDADSAVAATLRGVIRDSGGHPVDGATVSLVGQSGAAFTTTSDSAGAYRFSAVGEGVYTLRAEMKGYGHSAIESLTVVRNESKTIDLALAPTAVFPAQDSHAQSPQFFDEPHFTVAGVTDTTSLGGHGSDTLARNRESLAKDTAALSTSSPPASGLASPDAAKEKSLRTAVERKPTDFDANYQLGKLLVDEGKAADALVYLQRASSLKPDDRDARYGLALARANSGDYERARIDLLALLTLREEDHQKNAASHHLLGAVCEKLNDPLGALKEYQLAAELDPSDLYFFDWGAELLLHHAAEPAVEVFTKGNRLFPHSARILAGLGASWYALGSYDQAVRRLGEASDLNPDDPYPYLFMGKMQAAETASSDAIRERLSRFVELHPENALASYYYAISIFKQRKSPDDAQNFARVRSLLEKAVQLDPALGPGYLQLGILYSEQRDFPNAIAAYQHAITTSPDLEEAHFRLAEDYRRTGESAKAQAELQLYEKISGEKAVAAERQRHEVQQFVYQLRSGGTDTEPQ